MRVKRRIHSGPVCEQIVYTVPDGLKNLEESRPARPRFQTEEDRARHRDGVARRRHARIVNANFGGCLTPGTVRDADLRRRA